MGMEWGEAYRNLHAQKDAGKTPADLWEERRLAHWKRMHSAWERWEMLVKAHEEFGYNGRNPFAGDR